MDSPTQASPQLLLEFQALFDNASVGILLTADRKIQRYNPRFGEMFRFKGSEAVGTLGTCLYRSDEEYAVLGKLAGPLLSQGKSVRQELYMRRADGSDFWANLIGYVADPSDPTRGTWWIIEDRSEVKVAEESLKKSYTELSETNIKLAAAQSRLVQSEKLAAIGLLAGGVAHEINNPIGFINSNLGSLKTYVDRMLSLIDAYEKIQLRPGASMSDFATVNALKTELDMAYLKGDVVDLMDECRSGLERVKNIVQSLKDFSQIDSDETWRKVNIHQGIDAALNVLSGELPQKCEIRKAYGEVAEIECRLSQLKQVFVNLLANAVHAIDGHGTISICTGSQEDQVWITVSDTGSGIAAEHLPHIFDPFFTTKPVGKGTGLGLSVAYSIIQNHHGRIEVTSQVGSGTTFRICLPFNQPA